MLGVHDSNKGAVFKGRPKSGLTASVCVESLVHRVACDPEPCAALAFRLLAWPGVGRLRGPLAAVGDADVLQVTRQRLDAWRERGGATAIREMDVGTAPT